MMNNKQITVAVSGNSFGNQYAIDGISGNGYYSTWTIKMKIDSKYNALRDYTAILKDCNLDKSEIPQKYFDNIEIFNNLNI